jgi:hypothetical protein
LQVPAGAEIQVRLKTKISTQSSKVKDPVEAVAIAPVRVARSMSRSPTGIHAK